VLLDGQAQGHTHTHTALLLAGAPSSTSSVFSKRLQVLWQQLSMQHNFDKYMLQKQAEYPRVFGMLERACERALRRAADGRHPWRER